VTDRAGPWALAVAGAAIGGTAVFALAAAARFGLLRALLEVFPGPTWDAVTWGLIPALLLVPSAVQGAALARLGARPALIWRAIGASVLGTLAAMAVLGTVLLEGVRRLPPRTVAVLAKSAPDVLIVAFVVVIVGGWLLLLGRLLRQRWLGRIAVPLAALAVGIVWGRAHGSIVALSYVLDRPEANGFFAAVTVGGAIGGAWAVRPARTRAVASRGGAA